MAVVLWTASQPVDELTVAASAADFEILLTEDSFEMLEDLVLSAVKGALQEAKEMSAAEMGKLTEGLGLPADMKLPF